MTAKRRRKPYVFEAGADESLPGPYCKFCHYSPAHAKGLACPKRGVSRVITDKERLDWAFRNGTVSVTYKVPMKRQDMFEVVSEEYTTRQSLDAAILADRKRRKGEVR